MKKSLYLFSSGRLFRKENTVWFKSFNGQKKVIPINALSEIEVFGEVEFNKNLLGFLSKNGVLIHFYNRHGYYIGSFYPREKLNSGFLIVKQAEHYLDEQKRLFLAKKFIEGAVANILRNIKRSDIKRKTEITKEIKKIWSLASNSKSIRELMALEGNARGYYHNAFSNMLKGFSFGKRTRKPPKDEVNALISFGNSLLYARILSEVYLTHLDPRIGYLHQSNMRSFSLNLDLAEIFKPLIVDRAILYLVNKKIITKEDFSKEAGICYLSDSGKRKFLKVFDKKLNATIKHRRLRRNVSHRRLIRLECHKLTKHFIGDEVYKPLKAWW